MPDKDLEQRLAALKDRVRDLESIEGIRDVIARYSWAVDTEDAAALGAIFTDDATIWNKWRDQTYTGKQAILEFFRQHRAKFKFTNRMSNLNERISVHGDAGKAEAYHLVMYTHGGASYIGWGTYEWDFRLENGDWRIARMLIKQSMYSTLKNGWGMETGRLIAPPDLEPAK